MGFAAHFFGDSGRKKPEPRRFAPAHHPIGREPKFEKILTNTKVLKLEDVGEVLKVKLAGEGLTETELEFDKALI